MLFKISKEVMKEIEEEKEIENTINFLLLSQPLGKRKEKPSKRQLEGLRKVIEEEELEE